MLQRRPTRQVSVGSEKTGIVRIGGGLPDRHARATTPAPVSVQTMTTSYTHEVDKTVAEIHRLHAAGADLIRLAVPLWTE